EWPISVDWRFETQRLEQDSRLAGLQRVSAGDRRKSQDIKVVGAAKARQPKADLLRLRGESRGAGRRDGARGARSAVLRIPHHSGDRTVPSGLSQLRLEDREGGSVTEQGAVQQTLRRGRGRGLRECFGAASGPAVRAGPEHGPGHGSALFGTLERATQEAGLAAHGRG